MSDPFQNVDDAGIDFAQATAETMEIRQSEPVMERIVSNYLNELEFKNNDLTVEIGSPCEAVVEVADGCEWCKASAQLRHRLKNLGEV